MVHHWCPQTDLPGYDMETTLLRECQPRKILASDPYRVRRVFGTALTGRRLGVRPIDRMAGATWPASSLRLLEENIRALHVPNPRIFAQVSDHPPLSHCDTTPPETTITAQPAASTTETTASFSFSSSESGSSFACKLDGASWGSCGSPRVYSALGLGSHTFAVRATDAAGNVDPTPASAGWTVQTPADTTPPETSITSGPAASTTETSADFSFTSSERESSYGCKFDGGSWGSCNPPKGYSSLSVGDHTFAVRATDAAGNVDPTPASDSWTVQEPADPAHAVWGAPIGVKVGVPVTLDGTASAGSPPISCTWSFESEDGSTVWETRAGCKIEFTFQSTGMKYVRLIVQAGDGTTDSNMQSFSVGSATTTETSGATGPIQSSNCFSVPSSCGYPDATNTGPTGSLTPSGSINVTTDGKVLENLDITGQVRISADNVTIKNSRITGTAGRRKRLHRRDQRRQQREDRRH